MIIAIAIPAFIQYLFIKKKSIMTSHNQLRRIRKMAVGSFLVCILCLAGSRLFAQEFTLGLKGGANFSNFTGGNFSQVSKSTYVGFMGGAYLGFLIGDHFSIQPEVLFSSEGARIDAGLGKQDYKVNYITVPVLAKYRFTGGFYVEAGPQVGFKTGESVPNSTINHFAKDLDLSIDGGIGYQSPIGLGIGVRYTAGISKVGDYDGSNINPDFKNGVAQVFVFYQLFNNKK
jgi:outer membrane protein with beta-barrel domain